MLTVLQLMLALALPWAVGAAFVVSCWHVRQSGYSIAVAGMGFPLGVLWVVFGYYLIGHLGPGVFFLPNLALQFVLLVLFGALAWRRMLRNGYGQLHPVIEVTEVAPPLPSSLRYLLIALVCWMTLRSLGIFLEVILRPLFPWDAWGGFATEAKIWFHHPDVFSHPVVSSWPWSPEVVWQGGTKHPSGLALIWLWFAQAIGKWNDALINIAWPALYVCSVMMVMGFVRLLGASWFTAVLSGALLASLPMVSINAVLAGYADFWIAALVLMLAGLLGASQFVKRDFAFWLLPIVVCVGMLLIKQHGLLWVAVFVLAISFAAVRLRWALLAVVLIVLGTALGLWLGDGRLSLGPAGSIIWNDGVLRIPGGRAFSGFGVGADGAFSALLRHLFKYVNWHFFWYLMLPVFFGSILIMQKQRELRGLIVFAWSGFLLMTAVQLFSQSAANIVDGTSINRLTLHTVPALCLLFGLSFQRVWFFLSKSRSSR